MRNSILAAVMLAFATSAWAYCSRTPLGNGYVKVCCMYQGQSVCTIERQ